MVVVKLPLKLLNTVDESILFFPPGSGVNTGVVPPVKSTFNSNGTFKLLPAAFHIAWQTFGPRTFAVKL